MRGAMALIVRLARAADERELGSFDWIELADSSLRVPSSPRPLAKHVHHRWVVEGEPHSFTRVEITGPAWVIGDADETLGPYLALSLVNGVLYVDRRIFAFLDAQEDDWYLSDLGQHWKRIRIHFDSKP